MPSILQKVGCTVEPAFIDEFHHLVKNNVRVIVTFTQCKHCKQMIKVRKDSRGLTLTTLVCVGAQNQLYIDQSLCPYYRALQFKSKNLNIMVMDSINNFCIFRGTVKIVTEKSIPLTIICLDNFKVYFPDRNLSSHFKICNVFCSCQLVMIF